MPWNDKSDGGGPWGQGGSRGGPQPPDLEELLRRGQDRMKSVLPGGGLSRTSMIIGFGVLVLLWAFTGVYQVATQEEGVVLRFGKYVRTTQPGLHYHLPYPIETVYTPEVRASKQIDIGFAQPDRDIASESLMLTGDQNIVNVQFSVLWQVKPAQPGDNAGTSAAADYLFNVENTDPTVKAVAESAMREVIGRNNLQPILTENRKTIEEDAQNIIQTTLDAYGAGVFITQVQLKKTDPPDQVIEAYQDVAASQQDRARVINESRVYSNKIIPEARGEAQRIIQQAEAYRAQTVVEANGDATRFTSIYQEYKQAKNVTRERMFLETMERVLKDKNKVVIDDKAGTGVVPYLPLPEIKKRTEQGDNQ